MEVPRGEAALPIPLPGRLDRALKEWAVAVRALREGRQVILLRKGGVREAEGEFTVDARDVLLFPTFEHQIEQPGSIQPCYEEWKTDEEARRPKGESVRIEAWARITDILLVRDFDALFTFPMQHIYSEKFLRFRVENDPDKPLYCLFLRAYELPRPVTVPMAMDYYGCRSWITLTEPVSTVGSVPALSDHTYSERVRVTRRLLSGGSNVALR